MSDTLFKKLVSFECNDSILLQEFVENLEKNDLSSLVLNRILNPDGTRAFRYVLLGLTQKNASQKKRIQLIEAILKEIQKRNKVPNSILCDFIFQIAIEFEKFSTPHLIKICDLCVDFIRDSDDASKACWKELLPKLLNILETRKEIDHAGTEMTGVEYKKRVVQTICMIQWKPSIITTLTALFNELNLTGDQLCEVVNKLCRSINELPADEIPPFVHQLLNLCRERYASFVFLSLRNYFNKKIYRLIRTSHDDDEKGVQNDIDMDEILDSEEENVKNCESTVLYHIEEAAKLGHGSIAQLLKFAKSSVNCPEYIVDPFILSILFIISSISTYGSQVIVILKQVFIRNLSEEEKKEESAWLRTMIPNEFNMNEVVYKLIKSRACENDKVMKGLINLSLSFLALSKRSGAQNPECLWKLGQLILMKLVNKHKQVTDTVLKNLVDCIFGGQNTQQYTDCLRGLCAIETFAVIDKQLHLTRLVEMLTLISSECAEQIIIAIVPIIKLSTRLRDSLISSLRKALFYKEKKTKEMAVSGFLKLLKYLNIKKLSSLSQPFTNDFSVMSVFSQISADIHLSQQSNKASNNSNEAICLEVVNILKRCFVQSAEVRMCLYEGLFDVIEHNPVLGPTVLELLLNHFSGYYHVDQSVLPPIDFSKAVTIQGANAVLQEPLGHLLLIIQQVVVKVKSSDQENEMDESFNYADKFTNILNSLITRFTRCDLNHFELDEETNILDILPECQQRQQILYQTIAVYEALMAYIAFSWNIESTKEQGTKLESLFKVYNLLYDYIKNCKPNKKKDGYAKKDKVDGKKYSNHPVFKPPETILNLNAINRILSLLLCENLDWATSESTADLRTRRPILRYTLQAASEAIANISKTSYTSSRVLTDCFHFGRLLYTKCFSNYERLKDYDLIVAVHIVESFFQLFSFIVTNHKSKLAQFLEEIVDVSSKSTLTNQLKPIILKLQNLLEDISIDEDSIELYLKREAAAIINCICTVNLQLPVDDSHSRLVTDCLLEFAQKKTLPFAPVTKIFLSHMLVMLLRCKTDVSCLDNMALQICNIIGSYDDRDIEECQLNLSILNEASVFNALPLLCTTLVSVLEDIKWLLSRLRAEVNVSNFCVNSSTDNLEIKRKMREKRESELVRHTGLCVNIAQTIVTIAVPAGPCTDIVFSMLSKIFICLSDVTKYFTSVSDANNRVYETARFGKVVKLASFHLADEIPDFILHVEESTLKNQKEKHEKIMQNAKKQAQYIPKLTGDLENFTKCVSVLSTRCKDPHLASNLKLTTTRDFRVNLKKVEEIMNRQNMEEEDVSIAEEEVEEVIDDVPASAPEHPRKKLRKS